ncbi:MTH1187 family thiamine-binding protein [Caldivirga sp. UBA161]|uniref:MTH1187 family thiamine-binding protein n=1 Tax=Caldivirga sp. UBA161 TaxID=1915569 RepID=UPI0025BDEB2C|nr:MTH1187 family thiamine-binding protein [Caldivirga sp. UBA161]
MTIIVEIAVDPIGTGSTSVGDLIKQAVSVIARRGYKYQVCAMGTVVELPSLRDVGSLLEDIHEELVKMGVKRIVSVVRIDDRRDKSESIEYKVSRVTQRPGG